MRGEFFFQPGNDTCHRNKGDHQDARKNQDNARPFRRDLDDWKRSGLSVIAQNFSRSLQGRGDGSLHASQVNGVLDIIPRKMGF